MFSTIIRNIVVPLYLSADCLWNGSKTEPTQGLVQLLYVALSAALARLPLGENPELSSIHISS